MLYYFSHSIKLSMCVPLYFHQVDSPKLRFSVHDVCGVRQSCFVSVCRVALRAFFFWCSVLRKRSRSAKTWGIDRSVLICVDGICVQCTRQKRETSGAICVRYGVIFRSEIDSVNSAFCHSEEVLSCLWLFDGSRTDFEVFSVFQLVCRSFTTRFLVLPGSLRKGFV
jgi:hypothetical protein